MEVVILNWNQMVTLNWNWMFNITGIRKLNPAFSQPFKTIYLIFVKNKLPWGRVHEVVEQY